MTIDMAGVSLVTMQKVEVMLVGSANMDLVISTPRFPLPGETLTGQAFQIFGGGKGANQATAVGKLGGQAGLIAKVGQDSFGEQLVLDLSVSGVRTEFMLRDANGSTGVALITVDGNGQNTIVVAPGTNALLTPTDVEHQLAKALFKVLLVQLEIPTETVLAAAQSQGEHLFILNPAPAKSLSTEILSKVDYLTPNETEAHALTGILAVDDDSCLQSARVLFDQGVNNVLFTLGEKGSYLATHGGGTHFPAFPVTPVDTTGAGDAFNGAFAHFLAQGKDVEESILLANIVGALSTTKPGAQASMPSLAELAAVSRLTQI